MLVCMTKLLGVADAPPGGPWPADRGGTAIASHSERESARLPDAAPAPGAEMLKAIFDNMHQGFLMLDDQWRVTSFNARLSELIGYPAGVVRAGASAYDLVCAAAALGHYHGRSVEEAYEHWRQRLSDHTPSDHLSPLSDGRTVEVSYAPFGAGG
jgi:PAS domain-containing protein